MSDQILDVGDLARKLAAFADARDWEQFHTPKNLVMALAGEVGELTELFQWLTQEQSATIMDDSTTAQAVRNEIADVLTYLIRLADVLGVHLGEAIQSKLAESEGRYPVEQFKGSARKADSKGAQE